MVDSRRGHRKFNADPPPLPLRIHCYSPREGLKGVETWGLVSFALRQPDSLQGSLTWRVVFKILWTSSCFPANCVVPSSGVGVEVYVTWESRMQEAGGKVSVQGAGAAVSLISVCIIVAEHLACN